ncbi:helix-turn-helix domain-containing protein [Azoarcus sp. TTM-91]|uniref:Crp/Fnr family transcriptional regulator n=1 Tax=Azoarcus sp. TTM-91 TaxID=2691581 RepID=UPI00145E0F9D|nr:Crp/Fnr family transcriptional regulator [Azoarcus sp. TTM-91]NMG35744.1 helix-turn-helix domain-containing protein [Azoarcus sp. TTM-91]
MSVAVVVPQQDVLGSIAPFDLLDDSLRRRLLEHSRPQHLLRGEMLLPADGHDDQVFLVLEGSIKRYLLSATGAELVVQLAGAGDSFGEDVALLARAPLVTNQAVQDSRLLRLRGSDLRAAMHASPAFAAALSAHLAEAMYALLENLQQCFQRNSLQRVAHYLARLAPANAERCEIRLESDKQTIAAQLNLTPETLSRALSRLTRDGTIRPQGRRGVVVNKVSELRLCAAG